MCARDLLGIHVDAQTLARVIPRIHAHEAWDELSKRFLTATYATSSSVMCSLWNLAQSSRMRLIVSSGRSSIV